MQCVPKTIPLFRNEKTMRALCPSMLCVIMELGAAASAKKDNAEKPATSQINQAGYRDLYPDTWAATDALGRQMPDITAVGPLKNDRRRVVGIFYIVWHSDSLAKMKSPYTADVSNVLAKDPISLCIAGDNTPNRRFNYRYIWEAGQK